MERVVGDFLSVGGFRSERLPVSNACHMRRGSLGFGPSVEVWALRKEADERAQTLVINTRFGTKYVLIGGQAGIDGEG